MIVVQVEGVEDFGQDIGGAYDEGRDDRDRYDDDRYWATAMNRVDQVYSATMLLFLCWIKAV